MPSWSLPNAPSPVWYILSVPAAFLVVVLSFAFLWTWSRAECRTNFLAWQVGPDKNCPEYSEYPMTSDQAASFVAWKDREWCDMSAVRHKYQKYENGHDFPIEVAVSSVADGAPPNFCLLRVIVDDRVVPIFQEDLNPDYSKRCAASVTVPPGSTYSVEVDSSRGEGRVFAWYELTACEEDLS